ncbi:MAG: PaaI family thioesterase [Firmicutes bacterium]|nr:PaaI family thioesterase [Bacillota bacterium]
MDLENIRSMFRADRFATDCLGAIVEDARPGYARCSFEIAPQHMNAVGGLMGGTLFTLADFAFAIASNVDQPPTVSISSSISFMGAAKGKKIIAEANCQKSGRTTCTYLIHITDELGTAVALVTIVGFIKR